ncbi:MAG: response regulator [Deltaproteobacteria bacterium]|nr:response regulator [Deltaproteobacteria bacterium]MBT6489597.1 response regulator [Deltaproteobacteria bacterium]
MVDHSETTGSTKRSRKKVKPRVLCVDDEPYVLEGLQVNLRRHFDVSTATSGREALRMIHKSDPYCVILSDMRMPEMDGASFLSLAKDASPDSSRVLLTGHADLEAAVKAVNEGGIFAYLSKPCPAGELLTAFEGAHEHHQIVVAEREILEETLWGSVNVMAQVLGLVNEEAFGRTEQLRTIIIRISEALFLPNIYEFEIAAMVSQIGCVMLPGELLHRIDTRQSLTAEERKMFLDHPKTAQRLLQRIPRLEDIAVMVGNQHRSFGAQDPERHILEDNRRLLGANLLRLSLDTARLVASGLTRDECIAALELRPQAYDPRMLAVLSQIQIDPPPMTTRSVTLEELEQTMIIDQDVTTIEGLIVIRKGHEVTEMVRERLERFNKGVGIKEPIRVLAPRSP